MHDRASNSCCNSSSVQSGFGSTIAGVRRVGLGDNVLRVNVRFRACAAGDANVGLENKSPPPRACGDITDDIVTIAYTECRLHLKLRFSTSETWVIFNQNTLLLHPPLRQSCAKQNQSPLLFVSRSHVSSPIYTKLGKQDLISGLSVTVEIFKHRQGAKQQTRISNPNQCANIRKLQSYYQDLEHHSFVDESRQHIVLSRRWVLSLCTRV